ncbi:Protein-lysine N-methyltransferase efm5 [Friedmanniomyces endolithicus]|uniref:Protein-lysine N-methyltransferase efm5 n=1 Tax=Rachicladosporium monterosium TaxID=1507873 RepID=A0ABR0L427_9PEZI|nr:Protein-lysine N-methyltransferase efm5 [Friedmanniomyces endolithicus]KAK1811178.1 Protein-lysine N-methyltransferase efm5 [Friedmanniomyces endolithicus]KAK5142658.1 Protein-lysine N-methyltransferase efm5 [Rachicladosporium monterosium]
MAFQRQLCRVTTTTSTPLTTAAFPKPSLAPLQFRRNIQQDIAITRTGKPIIRISGGRSSLGGHTATVFGATGFLGRYIVNRLARAGCTVVVPFRDEYAKRHLKVSGDLGRVVFIEYDLRNTTSIEESVRHSDIVYNLVGRDYETKNFDFDSVHVEGTRRIAEAVAKYDVDRFVQVSSHSANPQSPSKFYRTKYHGEQVAKEIFPETTVVRPAPMFGFEDRLLHRLANATNLLSCNNMQERFWPVHCIDVGAALEQIGLDDTTVGQTYELHGPKEYNMMQLKEMVDREILKTRRHINVPKAIMAPMTELLNKVLWWPVGSRDEVEREYLDQVIDKNAKTFKDLDMEPADIANFTFKYLQHYRSSAYYDLPPMTEREKREEKKYLHVLDDQ